MHPTKILLLEYTGQLLPVVSLPLRQRAEFEVFETSDEREAFRKAEKLQPDLILLDAALLKLHGIQSAMRLLSLAPNAKLLLLAEQPDSDLVREGFRLGAQGCIHRQRALSDLLPAINAVLGGKRFDSPGFESDEGAELAPIAHTADGQNRKEVPLHLAGIVESSDDAIISKDLAGVISAWNSAAQRIFGYTEEEAVGRPISIIIPPELHDEENDILKKLRAGQRIDHCETRRVSKDGRTIDVVITIFPIRDVEGRIIGASKIARDITEKKRADAALRESEERFRLAMNNVAAGLYTLDLEGLVTYINPAAETMFGWTNTELLGRKMHDVTHYKHPDGTPFPSSDCLGLHVVQDGAELHEHEDVFIRKDGSFFPVVFSASPLKRDGKTVGIVVGFRDDTQRREADRAIRESEDRFRLVANAAPVMIRMSGADMLCTYFNQGWLDFTGRSIEAELGNGWLEAVYPDDLEGCRETYTKAFDQQKAFRMEYRLRRNDAEYRWVFDQGVPRFDVDGSFAGYISSAIDVTERKLAEEALSRVSQRLLEAQEAERRRIARELHDDITQQLSLLLLDLERWRVHPSLIAVRKGIAKAIERASNLGDNLRAFSHRLHSSNLEYLGLAEAASGYCSELSDQHQVEIDLHSENIRSDLSWEVSVCLFRVLQEALQNAVKHSGAGHFEVSLIGGTDEIALTVRDSGAGFDPEQAIKGHGLGLTSMKERLKLVKGKVSIDSQLGLGTTIHARVPLPEKSARTGA
jgi:PAS domain S-box-containing protein